jgi:hypothetical protein
MLLRAGSQSPDDALGAATGSATPGIAHGAELSALVEAVVASLPRGSDREPLERARAALRAALGDEGFVDACAVLAQFSMLDRIADGVGIPVEPPLTVATQTLRHTLGLDAFASAGNTPALAGVGRLVGRLVGPLFPPLLRLVSRIAAARRERA